jgi:hypothetical protein
MQTFRARLIAALTVVAVLLPGSAFARTQYFCRMMNRVVSTCCCHADKDHGDRGDTSVARLRATDCCQKLTASDHSVTASTAKADCSVPAATVAAAPPPTPAVLPPKFVAVAHPIRARAPPAIGPPRFIAHCSFLI